MKRLLAVLLGLALALVGTVAAAAWLSTGSAQATATATTVRQANQPTAVRGAGHVTLSWAASTLDSGDPVGGYRVVRHDGSTTTTACTVSAPTHTCVDPSPVPTAVTYGVIATVGTHWEGPESVTTSFTYDDVAPVTTAQVSPAPNSAAWSNSSVTVSLQATDTGSPAAGVDHIHYVLDSGTPVDVIGATASVPVTGTGTHTLTYGAVDKAGNTESAQTLTVKIDPDLPLVTNLQPTSGTAGTWAAMKCASGDGICADASDALSGVAINGVTYALTATSGTNSGKCWNGTSFATGPCAQQPMSLVSGTRYAGSTGLSAANLAAGSYTLVVKATDVADNVNSAASTFTVKADQTITFGPLSGRTLGDAPFGVSATASSGLGVTFSSATTSVCTVSGSTVTLVATGTCTINADQAGNANYNPAPQVQQSFAVKANQTITFNSAAPSGATVGGATYTVTATASSGLAVTFSSGSTNVCTVTGSTVSFSAVGTCTVNADQAGNNTYNAATQKTQSFTVGKGSQTILFTSPAPGNATVGGATYAVTATASSGLAVTFSSGSPSVCTVSGSTVNFVGVGTCSVRADQSGNANYSPASRVSQAFAVNRPFKITGRVAGPPQNATTINGTGVVNAAVTVYLCSDPVSSCNANSSTLVGSRTATVDGTGSWSVFYNKLGDGTFTAAATQASPSASDLFTFTNN